MKTTCAARHYNNILLSILNHRIRSPVKSLPQIQFYEMTTNRKERIYEIVKKEESRKIRQDKLFKIYTENVKYNKEGNMILIAELCNKYNITQIDIIKALYYHKIWLSGKNNIYNPFNLPEFRIISHKHYDRNKNTDWYIYERELRNKYIKDIMLDNKDGIDRIYMPNSRYIILRKDGNYDYSQLGVRFREPLQKDNNTHMHYVFLVEKKDPLRNYDSPILEGIYEMSLKYGGNIKNIGTIGINQKFDGSNIFDINAYDSCSPDAFETALIARTSYLLQFEHYQTDGDMSIVNADTIKLINDSLDKLNLSEDDRKKLYHDFTENTVHTNNDTMIQIGKLMDLYKIESHELLYAMFKATDPCGYGYIEYDQKKEEANSLIVNDYIKILEDHEYYIDYLYGKPIKARFRKTSNEEQTINVKRYDYDNPGLFYRCLFMIMKMKMNI